MSALSHLAAHEIARDLGCLVSSQKLSPSSNVVAHGAKDPLAKVFFTALDWLRAHAKQRSTLRQLRRMPDHLLEDIGLERAMLGRVSWELIQREQALRGRVG